MPELPEVETVVREIRPNLVGRRLTALKLSKHSLRRKWSKAWTAQIIGRRVEEVRRRGKWIIVRFDDDTMLLLHLGMTGQLLVAGPEQPLRNHTHFLATLDDGNQWRFRDVRRFGSVARYASAGELDNFFQRSGLGPEPFDLEADHLHDCLRRTARCLKAVLLDQRVVAGVGNIYADESLFQAKLPPTQLGRDTTRAQAKRLRQAIASVLGFAIEKRGSSIRDYVGGSGQRGEYQREFRVYGRTGKPCPRCRTLIERMRLAGRSTHYCPQCQRKV